MWPKQQQNKNKQETLPVSAQKNIISTSSSFSSSFDDYYISFYLSLNFVTATYRAYAQNDGATIVFVLFIYAGYFALDYCSALFHQLPPGERSFRKSFLRCAVCGLGVIVLFGFAYEFSTFMCTPITLLAYAMASGSCCLLVYVYFVLEDENDDHNKVCDDKAIKISSIKEPASFCPDNV